MVADGNGKTSERKAAEALARVPDDILLAGRALYRHAVRRSKVKRISVREAFRELADELPEPLRSAALDVVGGPDLSRDRSGRAV